MHSNQNLSSKLIMPALLLAFFACVSGMVYGGYSRYQYLGQRNLAATDVAVADAAKGSSCMAARMKRDRTNRGEPVTNDDIAEFRRDCDVLAVTQQEQARNYEAALSQAKALQQ